MKGRSKFALLAVFVFFFGIIAFPVMNATAAVEFYDPLPDSPGKFMGPHGPSHTEWHYHGPPANMEAHCDALEDSGAPEEVHGACHHDEH